MMTLRLFWTDWHLQEGIKHSLNVLLEKNFGLDNLLGRKSISFFPGRALKEK